MENLAKWIEIQLRLLATKHESYIKDTKSFLAHIEELNKDYGPLPEGTRLITWDIENYYPNCDTPMCIQAVKEALDKWGENSSPNMKECVCEALEITMSSNNG